MMSLRVIVPADQGEAIAGGLVDDARATNVVVQRGVALRRRVI